MNAWLSRMLIVGVLLQMTLLTSGCSQMHGGIAAGHYFPVSSDLSGGTMYGFDLHLKLNDKWRAGVELQQLKDFGGDYSFVKTYSGPSLGPGDSVPATSTITMTNVLYDVQYYLKENLILDTAFGESRSQVNEESSSYTYSAPIGDEKPSGTLVKVSLLYTTRKPIVEVFPYIGVSYLHLDARGTLHKADGSSVVFSATDALGVMVGILM